VVDAVKLILACALPAVAVPMVGAPGTVTVVATGVTLAVVDAAVVVEYVVVTEQV
jgi:hypothetical protein